MNPQRALSTFTSLEPILWLLLLVVLHIGTKLARSRQIVSGSVNSSTEEEPPDYRAFKFFALVKWVGSLSYPVLYGGVLPLHLSGKLLNRVDASIYWSVYFVSAICIFYIMGAILRKGLAPLPGLSRAGWTIFRWVAVLTFLIALTAHIPIFGVHDVRRWMDEVSFSFMLCICMFEISLLVLLLTQLRRLGMFLMSRPIGLALGLAILGLLDLAMGVTANAGPEVAIWVGLAEECGIVFVVVMWSVYILRPEPKRLKHTLSPASRLSKWDDIARRIGVAYKETEHVPFITTVESVVDRILERHREKAS